MNLAFSNIAWPPEQDDAVAAALRAEGVTGLEIAPTTLRPDPTMLSADECRTIRRRWQERGLPIVAAQSLLFGRPDLVLFETAAARAATLDYLKQIVTVCAQLGAESLVFGSPKNRRRGDLPLAEAQSIAVDFFRELAVAATDAGTCLVLEANPPEYGADYVTHAAEALALVRAVDRPGLRLHLDTACMTLAGDDLQSLGDCGPWLRHFHVSEPNLAAVGPAGIVDLVPFAAALRRWRYDRWVSVEMRRPEPFSTTILIGAVRHVRAAFFEP